MSDGLIDAVHEAAVLPDGWPRLLYRLAQLHGAKGGLLAATCLDGQRWLAAPEVANAYEDFVACGWQKPDDWVQIAVAARHPGFLTDADIYSEAEIARGNDA